MLVSTIDNDASTMTTQENSNKDEDTATATNGVATATSTDASPPQQKPDNNSTFAMFVMAAGVVSAAGFTMYTKQVDALLNRMNRVAKIQQGRSGSGARRTISTTTTSRTAQASNNYHHFRNGNTTTKSSTISNKMRHQEKKTQ